MIERESLKRLGERECRLLTPPSQREMVERETVERETVEREAAEARRAQQEQLAFVMHDLRAPVNAIALAVEVLDRVLPVADADSLARRMLASVRRNAEQLGALADELLETSGVRGQAAPLPVRRPVELHPLVQAVAEEFEPLARSAGARIANHVTEGLMAYADPALLARIFQNLIGNAIDHAPGGQITVGGEPSSEEGAVVCWVSDDGEGIHARRTGRELGERAATASARRARGFGLLIVEQLIRAHGGQVAVESAEGRGTTFWFELPGAASV